MIRALSVMTAAALALSLSVCSKKVDTTKYVPVCEKISKCLKAGQGNPLAQQVLGNPENCLKFFGKGARKDPAKMDAMAACINESKCEELDQNLNTCFTKMMQGAQGMPMGN